MRPFYMAVRHDMGLGYDLTKEGDPPPPDTQAPGDLGETRKPIPSGRRRKPKKEAGMHDDPRDNQRMLDNARSQHLRWCAEQRDAMRIFNAYKAERN